MARKGKYAETIGCPVCGDRRNAVIDSRPVGNDGVSIRRRRECARCGRRFTTYEMVSDSPEQVEREPNLSEVLCG